MVTDSFIVGINQYQDDNWHNFKSSILDTEEISLCEAVKLTAKILEQYAGIDILPFPQANDEQMTNFNNISQTQKVNLSDSKNALSKSFISQKKLISDTVLFYSSGHRLIENKDIPEVFFTTSDVNTNLGFHDLSSTWLHNLLQKSSIKQQISWLDSYYEQQTLNPRDLCFITASRILKSLYEDVEFNSSVLPQNFLNRLNPDIYPQKWISNYNLIQFINQNLHNQNPRLLLTNLGDPINQACNLEKNKCNRKRNNNNHIMPEKKLDYDRNPPKKIDRKVQDFNNYLVINKPSKKSINDFIIKLANESIIISENPQKSNSKKFQQAKFEEPKSIKQGKKDFINYLSLFAIISLIGTAVAGYFVFRDIRLDSDNQVILNCVAQKNCSESLEALENLIKAKKSLESYNFNNTNLKYANLESANLKSISLYNTDLKHTNLKYASLLNADIRYADLKYSDIRYANLKNADLRHTKFYNTDLRHTELKYADLRYTELRSTDLEYTDLRSTDLRYGDLENSNLRYANLENADLRYANLKNADLRYTNLKNTNLRYANLENANLIQSKSLNPSQIKMACNWEKAMYIGNYNTKSQKWIVEKEANQKYIEQLKKDQASDPKETIDCINVIK